MVSKARPAIVRRRGPRIRNMGDSITLISIQRLLSAMRHSSKADPVFLRDMNRAFGLS
ncbi:hypothetical protein [Raoultibacter phocaeensis]|uniref:hypothetical protein n=1 Tax=Raoultibacter phocaeensis TaxID=2479841 RepID=UPI0015D58537|nr:hypothetical protein [Raoultibacter phocaeensis]